MINSPRLTVWVVGRQARGRPVCFLLAGCQADRVTGCLAGCLSSYHVPMSSLHGNRNIIWQGKQCATAFKEYRRKLVKGGELIKRKSLTLHK